MHERLALGAVLEVLAADALAQVGAQDLGLVALAVVLEAAGPLAVAALGVSPLCLPFPALADLGMESERVAVQAGLDGLLPLLLVRQVVVAVVAVAAVAELPTRKAVAVQLQALRLGAVARLPGPGVVFHGKSPCTVLDGVSNVRGIL